MIRVIIVVASQTNASLLAATLLRTDAATDFALEIVLQNLKAASQLVFICSKSTMETP